jgi:hypothetical protein
MDIQHESVASLADFSDRELMFLQKMSEDQRDWRFYQPF